MVWPLAWMSLLRVLDEVGVAAAPSYATVERLPPPPRHARSRHAQYPAHRVATSTQPAPRPWRLCRLTVCSAAVAPFGWPGSAGVRGSAVVVGEAFE